MQASMCLTDMRPVCKRCRHNAPDYVSSVPSSPCLARPLQLELHLSRGGSLPAGQDTVCACAFFSGTHRLLSDHRYAYPLNILHSHQRRTRLERIRGNSLFELGSMLRQLPLTATAKASLSNHSSIADVVAFQRRFGASVPAAGGLLHSVWSVTIPQGLNAVKPA